MFLEKRTGTWGQLFASNRAYAEAIVFQFFINSFFKKYLTGKSDKTNLKPRDNRSNEVENPAEVYGVVENAIRYTKTNFVAEFFSSIILFKIRSVLLALKQVRQVVHSSRSLVQASRSLVRGSRSFKSFAHSSKPFACWQAVRSFKQAVRSFTQVVWPFTSPVSNGLAIRSKIFVSHLPVRASRSEYLISRSVLHLSVRTACKPVSYPFVSRAFHRLYLGVRTHN